MTAPAGKSIAKVAGTEILDEIKNTYSEGIKHGDIAVLSGYKLQCQKVYLTALPKWTPGGEKVSGYKLQCQKVYLTVLPKCTTGGEKVSGNKLQCQKVYLAALPKCTTGGEKVSGNKL